MHAHLVTILALAVLTPLLACGQDVSGPAVEAPATAESAETPAKPNGVGGPGSEAHAALPAAFPRDIPIPAELVAKSVESEHAGSYVAIFTGDLDPEDVYAFFSERLVAEGWTIDKALGAGPELGVFASKGERIATVISTRIDGRLHVELGVSGGS